MHRSRSRSRAKEARPCVSRDGPVEVAIFNAMSGGTICSFQAGWSWSVLDVKQEISKVIGDATSLLPSGRQLLFDAQILRDNDILKNVSHADAAGADSLHTLELSMLEVSDDFYVRYLAKRTIFGRMEMDHEFHEFEFCSSGRFRFARNFLQQGFFQGKRLRKECYLSAASLNVLKSIVLKSGIMQADDADLPKAVEQRVLHRKGRSTFSHSISKKWLRRQKESELPVKDLAKQTESRKYRKSKDRFTLASGREALDWEHENVEPFCFDTDFDSEFDDDSLSEASWSFSRQSTTGSVSSLETLSASDPPVVTTALRFVAERWEEAQVVADIVAKTYKPPPRQIPPKAKEALASPLSVEGEDFLILVD
ncbi:unnamed protein product [Durusdinium trenchii]|uniref:Ubiquitin-like domain-containing protein n=1 Tax=Durusdinium trenchii TaxID=1381693 RepID=A0ABP0T0W3_9DINO